MRAPTSSLVGGYAGRVGFQGRADHHAIPDIATMRAAARDDGDRAGRCNEIVQWVPVLAEYEGPVYFRLRPIRSLPVQRLRTSRPQIGWRSRCALCFGLDHHRGWAHGRPELVAADRFGGRGQFLARVLEMTPSKPLARAALAQAAEETGAIVTAEEHTVIGGLAAPSPRRWASWRRSRWKGGIRGTFAAQVPT